MSGWLRLQHIIFAQHCLLLKMSSQCHCPQCDGRLVPYQTKLNHQRALLKSQMLLQQNTQKKHDLAPKPSIAAAPLVIPAHLHHVHAPLLPSGGQASCHYNSISEFDVPILHISSLTPIDPTQGRLDHDYSHTAWDYQEDQCPPDRYQDPLGYHEDDQDLDAPDYDNEDEDLGVHSQALLSDPNEDNPDPFVVEHEQRQNGCSPRDIPGYLLIIYVMVSWLHLQFSLPCVVCNMVLAIIACLLTFLDPDIRVPFITLVSASRSLGVNSYVEILVVCPKCRDVYPLANSKYVKDTCMACNTVLFLSDLTTQENQCTTKTPAIKYPYLSLSDQISSLLRVPGVEAVLDEWCQKPQNLGHYSNIFDGKVCWLDLKAPDGMLFFSNLPHQNNGPDGELRIGVNLGVDWYVHVCHSPNMTYQTWLQVLVHMQPHRPFPLVLPYIFLDLQLTPRISVHPIIVSCYLIFDFSGIVRQISCARASSRGLKSRAPMKFSGFYIQLSLICIGCGNMESWFPQNQNPKVSHSIPCNIRCLELLRSFGAHGSHRCCMRQTGHT
jgi:hypothetical protein